MMRHPISTIIKYLFQKFKIFNLLAPVIGFQILLGMCGNPARANIFSHHEIAACTPYLDPNSSLPASCRGSQTDSVCHALEAIDTANKWAFSGAIVYTAAATACGIACFADKLPFGTWTLPICAGLMVAGGLVDIGYSIAASDDNYSDAAKDGRADLFKAISGTSIGVGAGGGALFGAALAATSVGSTSTTTTTLTVGGSTTTSTTTSTAGTVVSCIAFGASFTLATMKWINSGIYETAAVEEKGKLPSLALADSSSCAKPVEAPTRTSENINDNNGSAPPRVAGGNSSDPRTTISSHNDKLLPDLSPKSLSSAAMADGGTGMGKDLADSLPTLMNEMEKHLGLSANDIGNALSSGLSPADVIGKISPELGSLAADLAKNKGEIAKNLKISESAADLYASAGGGGSKGGAAGPAMPDLSALFGKKDGGGGAAAGGVSNVKFGKDEPLSGDIWHIGTKKSIFEIVSDKWTGVVKRFIREDQNLSGAAPGLANVNSVSSVRAPASAPAPAAR